MKHEGKIEKIKTRDKSYSIMMDGVWFGGFYVNNKLPKEIKEGNTIEVEYVQEGNYNNIKTITLIKEGIKEQYKDITSIRIGQSLNEACEILASIIIADEKTKNELILGNMNIIEGKNSLYSKLQKAILKKNQELENEAINKQ